MLRAELLEHRPFLVVLALIVAVRIWFTFAFPVVQISDYAAYYEEAQAFAGLRPLRATALNSTGPKLLYSVPFRLFGSGYAVLGLFNTLLYATAVVLAYDGSRRVYGRRTATVAAAACLLSVSELYFNNLACSEVPTTLVMAALFWMMVRGWESWGRAARFGGMAGLGVYLRSNLLPAGGLVLLHLAMLRSGWRHAVRRALLAQGVIVLVTLPLCWFNLRYFERFTPIIANSGGNLWYGNNPEMRGDNHVYAAIPEQLPPGSPARRDLAGRYRSFYVNPDPDETLEGKSVYEADDLRMRYALRWIRANPARYAHLVLARFQLFFFHCTYGEAAYREYDPSRPDQPRWTEGNRRLMEASRRRIPGTRRNPVDLWYGILAFGAALGLLITAVHERGAMLGNKAAALLIVAYYSMPFLLTLAANRYHVPVLMLLWVYLAHGLVIVAGRRHAVAAERALRRA